MLIRKAGSGDEVCTLFGCAVPVTINNNYAVCIEQYGVIEYLWSKCSKRWIRLVLVLASANVSL